MQTFLPYPDFEETASVLYPKKHLGNQFYHEGMILLRGGWSRHPASKMWLNYKGVSYKGALCRYLMALYEELKRKGKDYQKHYNEVLEHFWTCDNWREDPPWLGDPNFHASHRSNLLRKDREKDWRWYGQFNWTEPDNLPYIWPK